MRSNNIALVGVVAAGLLMPGSALASLEITEIMYDLPGADSSREWFEVFNAGSDPFDLGANNVRFFNKDGGHKITSYNNESTVLGPGAVAVVADSPPAFLTDWPAFSGLVLDSSFALGNVGDTIGLRLTDGTTLDSISYDSSMGAAGDGNSLNRSGSTLVASPPTPGSFSGVASSDNTPQVQPSEKDTSPKEAVASGGPPAPPMTLDLGGDRIVEAGAAALFHAQLYSTDGVPLQNVRYLWNFGDGETSEGQTVFYRYPYAGTYAIVGSADAGNGYAQTAHITAQVVPAEVSLRQESDGSLTVVNQTHAGRDLDISFWQLSRGGALFVIPEGTIILAGQAVRFASSVLNLPSGSDAALHYPDGGLAASAQLAEPHAPGITYLDAVPTPSPSTPFVPAQTDTNSALPSDPPLTAAEAAAGTDTAQPLTFVLVGLVSLLVLGAAGAWYARSLSYGGVATQEETFPSADEFEIVEKRRE